MAGKNEQRCIAVIPARGGSRRIVKKNIRAFAGRPVIEYAIALAHDSGLFDRVIVSTDNDEIAAVAEQAGADLPFVRPAALADDRTTSAAVLTHALKTVDARADYDFACCLYPVTPFLRADDLEQGLSLIADHGAGSVFAVTTFGAPIWRAFEQRRDGILRMIWPEHRDTRSQDLVEAVHDAGQFYWVSVGPFLDNPVLYTDTSRGIVLPRWRAHDVDTEEDWMRAELIYRALSEDAKT